MSKYSLAIIFSLVLFLSTSIIVNAQTDDFEGITPIEEESTTPVDPPFQEEPVTTLADRAAQLKTEEQADLQLIKDRYQTIKQSESTSVYDRTSELNSLLVSARYHNATDLLLSFLLAANQTIDLSGGVGFGQEEALTDAEDSILSLAIAVDAYDITTQKYLTAMDQPQADAVNTEVIARSDAVKVELQSAKTSLMELISLIQ